MGKQILVVEDEPSIADNIVYALSTDGFEPKVCPTGAEALEELASGEAVLIVLDVGLPDINGFELAKEIRNKYTTPIIFVTARSEEVDRIVGLEIGADDYMVKPFSPRELSARVKAVLRRVDSPSTKQAVEEMFQWGEFAIDAARHQIQYRGEVLELSRYEFRILEIFVRSPGRVYSREHLMQLAWEEPDMSLERTVDTHVKTLRQKLKAVHSEVDPIITHRGLGYSLREDR